MFLRSNPFVPVLLFLCLPAFLIAQPSVERERSLAEATRETGRLIESEEYLLAIKKLNGMIDSAGPGANLSTPLFMLTEANAAVDRNYPALDAARRFLRLYPDDPRAGEVYYRRGVTAYREGNRDEARESFLFIADNKGDRESEAYYWLARLMADADSIDLAEILADRSLQESTHEFTDDALYLSAWIKEWRLEYQDAATLYRRIVDEFPESDLQTDAQLRLGVNQARNGYHESALTLFSSLTPRTDRQQEELLFYTAESNAALGRHDKAIVAYNQFLRAFPLSARARASRYGLGWSQLQLRRYDESLVTFKALTSGSDSLAAAALYQIGAIHTVRRDTASAMAALHELVYRLPYESFSDNAYNQLGRIHYRRGNYDSARRYLQITARQFPESDVRVEAFHLLGESYAAMRQYDNAQFAFSRTRKLGDSIDPLVARGLFREGVMLYYIGRFNSAIDRLRQYVANYPQGAEIDESTFWLAEALYQDGTYSEAEQFYEAVVKQYPKCRYREPAMYGLAWAQFRQGSREKRNKFREAIASFDAFLKAYPEGDDVVEAVIRMADAHRFLGEYDKAIQLYESIGGRGGSGERAEEARVRLAGAFIEMRRFNNAVETYRDLVQRFPKSSRVDDYAFSIGTTYMLAANDSLAIVEMERFVRQYPESDLVPNALFTLGEAWYNLGEYETALGHYQTILNKYPNSTVVPEAIDGLRFALETMGRGREAVQILSNFDANNPGRLAADSLTFTKGMILFDNGEYEEAEEIFRKLVATYPESGLIPNAWYQVGKGYEYAGNIDPAIGIYSQIVRDYAQTNAALLALMDVGALHLMRGNYAEANQRFLLFISRFPESNRSNEAYYGAGQSFLGLGDTMQAIQQFKAVTDKVLSSEEQNDVYVDRSRIALAQVLWSQGDTDAALELLASVASRRRDYNAAEALLIRGKILIQVNDLSGALAELRRLTTEFTEYPESAEPGLLELARLYELLTNTADAIATYQTLIDVTLDEDLKAEAEANIARLKKKR